MKNEIPHQNNKKKSRNRNKNAVKRKSKKIIIYFKRKEKIKSENIFYILYSQNVFFVSTNGNDKSRKQLNQL